MLNAAVVGLGWWGRQIVTCLEHSNRVRITRGVDIDQDGPAKFAAEHGLTFTSHFEDVLKDPVIDAVFIVTPHSLHEPMVLAAADAGKQIFCEKPMALSGDGARRMLDACDKKGIVLGIGHERRFEGAWEEMARMLRDGELGTLLNLDFNTSYNNMALKPPSGWRQDPKEAPAGVMTALGVHVTDLMLSLAGPVTEVFARQSSRSDDYPNQDVLSVQFMFANGVIGSLTALATTPFYQRLTVFGDRGWVEAREVSNVDIPDPATLTWRGMDMEIHSRTYAMKETVEDNIHHWADAVAGKVDFRFTREQRLQNVLILEAIVKSSETGQPVSIA